MIRAVVLSSLVVAALTVAACGRRADLRDLTPASQAQADAQVEAQDQRPVREEADGLSSVVEDSGSDQSDTGVSR